jgi:hypothetical protein
MSGTLVEVITSITIALCTIFTLSVMIIFIVSETLCLALKVIRTARGKNGSSRSGQ